MHTRFAALLITALCSRGMWGQVAALIRPGGPSFSGSAQFQNPSPYALRTVVTGAPYSGEEIIEQVQTLSDGTHITQKQSPSKMSRDSSGRTRIERQIFRAMVIPGRSTDTPLVVEIVDPVAQVKYTLDTTNQVAHRQKLATLPARGVTPVIRDAKGVPATTAPVAVLEMARPQTSSEKLGTQTVEGVLAEGTRYTMIWPTGSQGNDRPISVISETWMSRDLKIAILSKSSDPRSGEHTQRLINISLSEPSASLFLPPPGYSVVDEEGPFTIKWESR